MASTMVSIDFPDGSIVSFDRVRRDMIVTLRNGSVMHTGHGIPARPSPPNMRKVVNAQGQTVEEPEPEPVLEPVITQVYCEKLGYKRAPIIGTDIWNRRLLRLDANTVSYCVDESSAPKGVIELNPGCTVRVIQSGELGRKDRYENGHNPGVGALLTNPMGAVLNPYSTPIGKPNCVELHIPVQAGNMINTVMGSSPLQLAYGGGMSALKKSIARTFYFSFESLQFAQNFAAALNNNIDVLTKQNPIRDAASAAKNIKFGGEMGNQVNAAMDQVNAIKRNMVLMKSPDTSLEWYKVTLNTELSYDILYEQLTIFYNQLEQYGIRSPYQ